MPRRAASPISGAPRDRGEAGRVCPSRTRTPAAAGNADSDAGGATFTNTGTEYAQLGSIFGWERGYWMIDADR
jgi:hypothetical protein